MGWTEVRDAIQAAVVVGSGLAAGKIVWRYQNADAPAPDYVALTLGVVAQLGQDYVATTTDLGRPAGQEIALTVEGVRECALTVEAFSATTADSSDALSRADRVRSSFLLPSVRGLLDAQGVSVFDSGSVAYVPDVFGVGFRGRAVLSARIYVPAPAVVEYTGYIATVKGSVTSSGGGLPGQNVQAYTVP